MLLRFSVSNFRSICDPLEVSLVARDQVGGTQSAGGIGPGVHSVAGVVGPHASGKSNLLRALEWLRLAVIEPSEPGQVGVPIEPFAGGASRPTSFSLELEVHGVRYDYRLDLRENLVEYEALHFYPEGHRSPLFERAGDAMTLHEDLGASVDQGAWLHDTSLALTHLPQRHEPAIRAFIEHLGAMNITLNPIRRSAEGMLTSLEIFDPTLAPNPTRETDPTRAPLRQRALDLLRLVDPTIVDVTVDGQHFDLPTPLAPRLVRSATFVHRSGDIQFELPYDAQSHGTRTWFETLGPALTALEHGTLLVIDDLECGLNSDLCAALIALFNDPLRNPHDAQLIFATRAISLLEQLHPDDMWCVGKSSSGATTLARGA